MKIISCTKTKKRGLIGDDLDPMKLESNNK